MAAAVCLAAPLRAEETKPAGFGGELAVPSPLGEQWLGSSDAPITIIEYASLTCPHCAEFTRVSFPELKKKYIETGKVRFALREFPLDPLSTAAFMLAHCAGEGHYYAMTDLLFSKQKLWAVDDNPADALLNTVKQAGFTQDSFNACLKDQRIYGAVNEVKKRGEKLGVDATPTFFINGKTFPGALSVKDLDEAITSLLPK